MAGGQGNLNLIEGTRVLASSPSVYVDFVL